MTASATSSLSAAMEAVRNAIPQTETGKIGGKSVSPSRELCAQFEVFENCLARVATTDPDFAPAVTLRGEILKNFKIVEEDASAGTIKRILCAIKGFFCNEGYVFVNKKDLDSRVRSQVPLILGSSPKDQAPPAVVVRVPPKQEQVSSASSSAASKKPPQVPKKPYTMIPPPPRPLPQPKVVQAFPSLLRLNPAVVEPQAQTPSPIQTSLTEANLTPVNELFKNVKKCLSEEEMMDVLSNVAAKLKEGEAVSAVVMPGDVPLSFCSVAYLKGQTEKQWFGDPITPQGLESLQKNVAASRNDLATFLESSLRVDKVFMTDQDFSELAVRKSEREEKFQEFAQNIQKEIDASRSIVGRMIGWIKKPKLPETATIDGQTRKIHFVYEGDNWQVEDMQTGKKAGSIAELSQQIAKSKPKFSA